jgi:hypothetical protein
MSRSLRQLARDLLANFRRSGAALRTILPNLSDP